MDHSFNNKRKQDYLNKFKKNINLNKPIDYNQKYLTNLRAIIRDNETIEFPVKQHPNDQFLYHKNLKTFNFSRWCGLGSNLIVLIDLLVKMKIDYDIVPENIVVNLPIYKNYNIYNKLLYINKTKINDFKNLSNDYLDSCFLKKSNTSVYGLGNKRDDIDLDLMEIIFDAYFNMTGLVVDRANEIIKKYNINLNNFNFILWRKTDKTTEIKDYPKLDEALKLLNGDFSNLIAQTDDLVIYEEFKKYKGIIVLKELGFCSNNNGIHHEIYHNPNKFDEHEHLLNLFAIIYIGSKSNIFIGYPGNLSFIVSVLKKFKNAFIIRIDGSVY
jgi:hypothetical protein